MIFEKFIGQKISMIGNNVDRNCTVYKEIYDLSISNNLELRVLFDGSLITADFRLDRLRIFINQNGSIVDAVIG